MPPSFTLAQVAEHHSVESCWVIIKDRVYDVTDFLSEHPGGSKIILKYAGRDATSAYEPIHPSDALDKHLPRDKHLGELAPTEVRRMVGEDSERRKTHDELRMERAQRQKPRLKHVLNVQDIEDVARSVLSFKALAYYASAAGDEITYQENLRAFSRIFFNARVLRPIGKCDPSTTILGFKSRLPLFVSGAALARLGHPLGEVNITRGCGKKGIIQMVSNNASLTFEEITAARVRPSQPLFFQLYKRKDDGAAAERVREIEALGFNAVFLTVDAPVAGSRERDTRAPFVLEELERAAEGAAREGGGGGAAMPDVPLGEGAGEGEDEDEVDNLGTAGALLSLADSNMSWEKTVPWLRSVTKLPIVLKGIQCVEDAVLAVEAGVDGIMISNHGGRQLDYSMPSIEVLYRLRKQRPDVFDKVEVYMDGGVRRGTDVVKALCLGAKAVGMGRPFLYAQSAYGEAGVERLIHITEQEIVLAMRLVGATRVAELVPEMVEQVSWQPILAKL